MHIMNVLRRLLIQGNADGFKPQINTSILKQDTEWNALHEAERDNVRPMPNIRIRIAGKYETPHNPPPAMYYDKELS